MVMATKPHPAATQPAPAPSTSATVPAPSQGPGQGSENNSGGAPVSPDNVGRLFVQQYYTVLNKAPHLLHRFYTKGSSFVHGRVDQEGNSEEPVYGQNEINLKIMALDFRECYAKIRQVDSYATLGEGVVVQVTGELSTHGKPMRRFTQTFVLAPHSARNYYVRNDIFRYHDEVFQDVDVEDEDNEVSAEEDIGESQPEKVEQIEEEEPPAPTSSVPINAPPSSSYYSPPPSTVSNGTNHLESPVVTPPKAQYPVESRAEEEEVDEPELEKLDGRSQPALPEETVVTPAAPTPPPPQTVIIENHQTEGTEEEKPEIKEVPPAENKIVSWADRARQSPANPPGVPTMAPKVASQPQAAAGMSSAMPKQNESFVPPAQRGSQEGLPQRDNRRGRGVASWPRRGPDGPRDGDRGRGGATGRVYPDNQQLFVGNLPQDIKDEELKDFFSQHGKVLEMRINRNTNPKLPFFGFIVFDDPGPVQNILNLRLRQPILFRDGYRLNVEEKKPKGLDTRPRMSRGDGRPNSGGPPPRGGSTGRGSGRVGQGMGPRMGGRGVFNNLQR